VGVSPHEQVWILRRERRPRAARQSSHRATSSALEAIHPKSSEASFGVAAGPLVLQAGLARHVELAGDSLVDQMSKRVPLPTRGLSSCDKRRTRTGSGISRSEQIQPARCWTRPTNDRGQGTRPPDREGALGGADGGVRRRDSNPQPSDP
jgi:hypothetical protein